MKQPIHHATHKPWPLAGMHALFAGVVFLVLAGVMLAPVMHQVLHHFHVEIESGRREQA